MSKIYNFDFTDRTTEHPSKKNNIEHQNYFTQISANGKIDFDFELETLFYFDFVDFIWFLLMMLLLTHTKKYTQNEIVAVRRNFESRLLLFLFLFSIDGKISYFSLSSIYTLIL